MNPHHPLTSQRISEVQLHPHGDAVAYVVSRSDVEADTERSAIWVAQVNAGEPRQLTSSEVSPYAPRWSPDGSSLAYVAMSGGVPQLFVVSARGGPPRQLSHLPHG